MLPRIDKRVHSTRDKEGEWICPKSEEVLKNSQYMSVR
jgi:hypothetical protein